MARSSPPPSDAPPADRGLLDSIEPSRAGGALEDELDGACQRVAALLGATVVSVYVLEEEDDGAALVVRGNVGFSADVVGNLRLGAGEGIVGWVAQSRTPLATRTAESDPHFKGVRGLGEESVPVLLAAPLVRRGVCTGVLVAQRPGPDGFDGAALTLAAVLAESIALLVEACRRGASRQAPSAAAAYLRGEPRSGGIAIGRVELLPTTAADQRAEPLSPAACQAALARIARAIQGLVAAHPGPEIAGCAAHLETILSDARLVDRLLAGDLTAAARDYARAPHQAKLGGVADDTSRDRARDIDELCALVGDLAGPRRLSRSGHVWIGERLGGFAAALAATRAAAVVLDGDGAVSREAERIARAAGLPLVTHTRGLFAWARPGSLVVVDGDRGSVRINPSATGLVAARRAMRER